MTNTIRNIATNIIIGTVAILTVTGCFLMPELKTAMAYVNNHLSLPMAAVFYTAFFLFFPLAGLIISVALENPLYDGGTRVGREVANQISNARNTVTGLVGCAILSGAILFLSFLTVACLVHL